MHPLKSIAAGLYLGIAAISFSAAPAHATLLSVADSTGAFAGADVVTFDDVNNLEWLDVTQSTNLSFNTVAGGIAPAGAFEGWRHATASELTALFTTGGFPPPFADNSLVLQPTAATMEALIRQLGITFDVGTFPIIDFQHFVSGIFDDEGGTTDQGVAVLLVTTLTEEGFDPRQFVLRATIISDVIPPPRSNGPSTGHWLVRSPLAASIPEPSMLILFGSGVVLLGAMRRRKRAW